MLIFNLKEFVNDKKQFKEYYLKADEDLTRKLVLAGHAPLCKSKNNKYCYFYKSPELISFIGRGENNDSETKI